MKKRVPTRIVMLIFPLLQGFGNPPIHSLYTLHTVDGSEIPFPTTWDGAKTLDGINYQPQQVSLPDFSHQQVGVSKNNGTPKSSILMTGFPLFSPSILVVSPLFLETSQYYFHHHHARDGHGDLHFKPSRIVTGIQLLQSRGNLHLWTSRW